MVAWDRNRLARPKDAVDGLMLEPDRVFAEMASLGLTVTSWTFRADEKTAFPTVGDEMAQFLYTYGIDALFTNHPDLFPRKPQ